MHTSTTTSPTPNIIYNFKRHFENIENNFKRNNPQGYEEREKIFNKIDGKNFTVTSMFANSSNTQDFLNILTTKFTPQNWQIGHPNLLPNSKYTVSDLLRKQYLQVSTPHNFFGVLPTAISIKAIGKEEIKLIKNILHAAEQLPETKHQNLINNNYGKILFSIAKDMGLEITDFTYVPDKIVYSDPHSHQSIVEENKNQGFLKITTESIPGQLEAVGTFLTSL